MSPATPILDNEIGLLVAGNAPAYCDQLVRDVAVARVANLKFMAGLKIHLFAGPKNFKAGTTRIFVVVGWWWFFEAIDPDRVILELLLFLQFTIRLLGLSGGSGQYENKCEQ